MAPLAKFASILTGRQIYNRDADAPTVSDLGMQDSSGLSSDQVVGIVAAIVGVVIFGLACLFYYRVRQRVAEQSHGALIQPNGRSELCGRNRSGTRRLPKPLPVKVAGQHIERISPRTIPGGKEQTQQNEQVPGAYSAGPYNPYSAMEPLNPPHTRYVRPATLTRELVSRHHPRHRILASSFKVPMTLGGNVDIKQPSEMPLGNPIRFKSDTTTNDASGETQRSSLEEMSTDSQSRRESTIADHMQPLKEGIAQIVANRAAAARAPEDPGKN
jgi:hypothetical protein